MAFHITDSDPSSRASNNQVCSMILLDLGSTMYSNGQLSDAMTVFDAAHVALIGPINFAAFSKQLQWARSKISLSFKRDDRREEPDTPDTYHEDECDVGPRPFLFTPLIPEQCAGTTVNTHHIKLTEAFILYNKALVFHARLDFWEAMRLYKAVAQILSVCTQESVSVHPKLSLLGMFVHNNMGHIAYIEGTESEAMSHFESSLFFSNKLGDVSSISIRLDIATVISNWCRLHWMTGDLNDHVYRGLNEVLRIRSSVLNGDHILVASAHYNLGIAEYARRRNDEAMNHLMRYLQVAAQTASATSMQADLDPIPALAYILLIRNEDMEDDPVAQELVRSLRTLQEKRSDLGPRNPQVASVLNYVGTILFHQRDFDHALLFFQEELRLEEGLLNHFLNCDINLSVSVTCNNIGRILQEQNRLPEAIRYYARALQSEYGDEVLKTTTKFNCPNNLTELIAKHEGDDLPSSTMNLYSTIWYNLGLIYDRLGTFGDAIKAFQMSLDLRRTMLGNNSADVACLMYNIAVLQMEQELLKEATSSFREALRIRRVASTGQLHDFHVVKTLQKLASLHKTKGDIKGALEACHEVFQIQKMSTDFDPITRRKDVGATLREIAELYCAEGSIDVAIDKAEESVTSLRLFKGDVVPGSMNYVAHVEELFASLLLLGSLYHENCEPEVARVYFTEAACIVREASKFFSGATALNALHEVSQMLATCHCAPEA